MKFSHKTSLMELLSIDVFFSGDTQLIGSPQTQTVPVGSDVKFTATYLGIPTPAVAWLTDGQPIVNSDRMFVETVENGEDIHIGRLIPCSSELWGLC